MKKIDTSILDHAIKFATDAHAGVPRRGKNFPYITHPMEAVSIAATMTDDQEILAAAALHDVIEDTDYTADDLRKEFGERITSLVISESDVVINNKTESESWHERKQAAIDRIKNSSREEKIVALSDKLSNIRAIKRDYFTQGDAFWSIFHVSDPRDHKWHYEGLVDSLSELNDTFAWKEFNDIVQEVFNRACK